MSNENQSSVNQIVTDLATQLAKKELKFDEMAKEQQKDQTKLRLLLMKSQENETEIMKKIKAIRDLVERENPGIKLPRDIDTQIANHLLVKSSELTSVENITADIYDATDVLKDIISMRNPDDTARDIAASGKANSIASSNAIPDYMKQNIKENEGNKIPSYISDLMPDVTPEEYQDFNNNMDERFGDRNHDENDFSGVAEGVEQAIDNADKDEFDKLLKGANTDREIDEIAAESDLEEDVHQEIDDATQIVAIQEASSLMGYLSSKDNVPEEKLEEYLGLMLVLSEIGSPIALSVYDSMSKKLPDGVAYTTSPDGQKVPDVETIREKHKEATNGQECDVAFRLDAFRIGAKQYRDNPEFRFENLEEIKLEATIEGQQHMLREQFLNLEKLLEDPATPSRDLELMIAKVEGLAQGNLDAALRLSEGIASSNTIRGDETGKKVFEILKAATMEGFIRNGAEFQDDQYTKNSKANFFRNAIQLALDEGTLDETFLRQMAEVDIDVSRDVLKEFISRQNEGAEPGIMNVISVLGTAITERSGSKTQILDIDDESKRIESGEVDVREDNLESAEGTFPNPGKTVKAIAAGIPLIKEDDDEPEL